MSAEDDYDEPDRKVTVHRVQPGQRVRIGPQGWTVAPPQHVRIEEVPSSHDSPAPVTEQPAEPPVTVPPSSAAVPPRTVISEEQLTRNGQKGVGYFWTQDRDELLVSIPVPKGTRAKFFDVGIQEQSLRVKLSGEVILEGPMQHEIDIEHDNTDWEVLDWERDGRRLLQVTLRKKIPHNLDFALWWSKLLVSEAQEVDVEKIPGRQEKVQGLTEAWKAAHQQFLASIKAAKNEEDPS